MITPTCPTCVISSTTVSNACGRLRRRGGPRRRRNVRRRRDCSSHRSRARGDVAVDAEGGAVPRRADEALTSDRDEANDVNNMKTTDVTPFGGPDLAKEDGNCPRV